MDTQKKREFVMNLKEFISELETDIEADIKDAIKNAIKDAFGTWDLPPSGRWITSFEPWESPPGPWWINANGEVDKAPSSRDTRLFGTERPTEPQALKAAEKMRRFNVMQAYIDKYAPNYEPDCGNICEPKYYATHNHKTGKWVRGVDYQCEDVKPYGPRGVVNGLIEKLNRGEIVL